MKIKIISFIVFMFIYKMLFAGTDNPAGSTITTGFGPGNPAPYSNEGVISTSSTGITSMGASELITNSGSIQISVAPPITYGIYSSGGNVTIINSGQIINTGNADFKAIRSTGDFASISNTASGVIRTIYFGAQGSNGFGISTDGISAVITNAGLISTSGPYGHGIYTEGLGSSISNSGSVLTSGDIGIGIVAFGNNSIK